MEKKYINDMSDEELEKLILENKSLQEKIENSKYNENMMLQEEELNHIFTDKKYLQIHNYYNSFYLSFTAIDIINDIDKEYLNCNVLEKYEEVKKMYDKFIEKDEENYTLKECKGLENEIDNLLKLITKQLQEYEEYLVFGVNKEDDKTLIDYGIELFDCMSLKNSYILNNDYSKIFADITVINNF